VHTRRPCRRVGRVRANGRPPASLWWTQWLKSPSTAVRASKSKAVQKDGSSQTVRQVLKSASAKTRCWLQTKVSGALLDAIGGTSFKSLSGGGQRAPQSQHKQRLQADCETSAAFKARCLADRDDNKTSITRPWRAAVAADPCGAEAFVKCVRAVWGDDPVSLVQVAVVDVGVRPVRTLCTYLPFARRAVLTAPCRTRADL
jgi:hypothetical protein